MKNRPSGFAQGTRIECVWPDGNLRASSLTFVAALALTVFFSVVLALLAANLPFLNDRLLAVVPLRFPKNLAIRLLELVALYFVVGGIGLLLEQRQGRIVPQGWEFYAITAALFLTLAFPGFVWRYLFKRNA